ncbi:hypothetical protein QHH_55 [Halomonas phage QHHSV-1]|nr:hypothetical protein QHH_55 [Halomonas phage QHHSV-1]
MPTTERYTLNELQQATLDVMAANVMPGDDEDLTRAAMTREDIIAGVQAVPGQDEVNGNHMGPTLHCLKRRGLVKEASWPKKGRFHITPMGITYVDLDGDPEPEVAREGRAEVTHIDPETRRVVLDEHERTPGEVMAHAVPSRDELLTSLAMEVAPTTWAPTAESRIYSGERLYWNEYQLRRDELINKPSWDDAPEWAQWLAQDSYGGWWWYDQKPVSSDHDGSFDAPGQLSETSEGAVPAGHGWRETLEARPATQAPSAGASSTACDDQHRPEPAEPDAEVEAALLASHQALTTQQQALEELDDARPAPVDPQPAEPAPAGAPEVTILQVAVHPPGTAWLDHDATVLIKLMDEGGGPYLDISSWDGPAAIDSLDMLEAVTNTARNLLREAEAREVGA